MPSKVHVTAPPPPEQVPATPVFPMVAPQTPGAVATIAGVAVAPTQLTLTGGVTVTENVACDWLPRLSVAVQVTGVVPIAKVVPDPGEQLERWGPSTWSVAVGAV